MNYKMIEIIADDGASEILHCQDFLKEPMSLGKWKKIINTRFNSQRVELVVEKNGVVKRYLHTIPTARRTS